MLVARKLEHNFSLFLVDFVVKAFLQSLSMINLLLDLTVVIQSS